MDITKAEQIALDDALVALSNRLKIGKSNFRLSSDLKSKEATLQVVYDVLKLTLFYKAFQITADVLEIYMQEHEDTHLYGTILSNELMNEDIKNSESYKEYYAIASGAEPPKTKARVEKKQVGSDKIKTPPTTNGKRLKTSAKAAKPAKKKQPAKMSKAKNLTVLSEMKELVVYQGVPDVPTYGSDDEQISWKSSDEEDDDEVSLNDDDDDDDDVDNQDDD
ncbi:hypothetical protein Tco_1351276, partial [Tanacetum coccineum]